MACVVAACTPSNRTVNIVPPWPRPLAPSPFRRGGTRNRVAAGKLYIPATLVQRDTFDDAIRFCRSRRLACRLDATNQQAGVQAGQCGSDTAIRVLRTARGRVDRPVAAYGRARERRCARGCRRATGWRAAAAGYDR